MKRTWFIFSMLLAGISLGQNLVVNPDFEVYFPCPNYVSQINYAYGWQRPTNGTSDYFNSCLGVPFSVSVPDNEFGYQSAFSGNGYAGLYAFYSHYSFNVVPDNKREYITSKLKTPLIQGEKYYAEFYISLGESSKYAVYDLGMLFSMNKPERNDDLAISQIPQINYNGNAPLADKQKWQKISGCFIADSAYQYITIGNFKNGFNTKFIFVDSQTSNLHYSYYFVDHITVKKMEKPVISYEKLNCDSGIISIANYDSSFNYKWSDNNSGATIYVKSSNTYWVKINDLECEISSDSIDVKIFNSPEFNLGNDTVINSCKANLLNLAPMNYFEPLSNYLWSTGENTRQINIMKSGDYTLTITDTNGCTAVDMILVKETCNGMLYIPNCFTPNNDGKNDYLSIYGDNIQVINFSIFNRWGMKVFESSNKEFSWTGDGQEEGVYIWTITYFDANESSEKSKTKNGIVSMIR